MVKSATYKEPSRSDLLLSVIACLPPLVLFIYLSFYNHPIGDDFWSTSLVRKYGYWEAQLRLHEVNPPRYMGMLISCAMPLSYGSFFGYKIVPVVCIILTIYEVACLLQTLTGRSRRLWWPAVAFGALYLCVIPGLAEGFYWVSALTIYHSSLLFFIPWCNYLLKWYNGERHLMVAVVVVLSMAAFMGCSELTTTVGIFVLMAVLVRSFAERRFDGLLFVQFGVALLCLSVNFIFRGSSNRLMVMQTENNYRVLYSARYAVVTAGYYIGRVLINPFFWAIAIPGCRILGRSAVSLRPFRWYFLAVWIASILMIPFSVTYLTGKYPPPLRISDMIVFFFLFGLIFVAASGMFVRFALPAPVLAGVIGILLIAGYVLPNNVSRGARDLFSGDAAAYDKAWNERIQMIRDCKESSCVVPRLKVVPFVFWFEPDKDEPNISEFFGKKILVR